MPLPRPTPSTSPRIEPTWWAPIALICVFGFYAPIVVLEATQRGTILEPWVCVVGLGAAVMAIRHERRPGWKVVAILAGLFHVVVVGVFLFLGALMRGWVSP